MALPEQLPWYAAGPVLGICVVSVRVLLGARLGVSGALAEIVARTLRPATTVGWRAWFFAGVVAGGSAYALAAGGPPHAGYGWVTDTVGADVAAAALLVVAGALLGFGARLAGGCTSGNALSGIAAGSPAGLAATATFWATAVLLSLVTEALR